MNDAIYLYQNGIFPLQNYYMTSELAYIYIYASWLTHLTPPPFSFSFPVMEHSQPTQFSLSLKSIYNSRSHNNNNNTQTLTILNKNKNKTHTHIHATTTACVLIASGLLFISFWIERHILPCETTLASANLLSPNISSCFPFNAYYCTSITLHYPSCHVTHSFPIIIDLESPRSPNKHSLRSYNSHEIILAVH